MLNVTEPKKYYGKIAGTFAKTKEEEKGKQYINTIGRILMIIKKNRQGITCHRSSQGM